MRQKLNWRHMPAVLALRSQGRRSTQQGQRQFALHSKVQDGKGFIVKRERERKQKRNLNESPV